MGEVFTVGTLPKLGYITEEHTRNKHMGGWIVGGWMVKRK